MKAAVIALTKKGVELAGKIGRDLNADIYVKDDCTAHVDPDIEPSRIHTVTGDFRGRIKDLFSESDALVFIMACGIAVRSIAPFIRDKQSDPAVVVVDELGRFAISLLSGHIGGANRLAGRIAAVTGGIPVITTATDINGVVAFDELAARNGCAIENIGNLKYISSELVNGGKAGFYSNCRIAGELPPYIEAYIPGHTWKAAVALTSSLKVPYLADKVLYIRPRNLILGIGCKKGKTAKEIGEAVADFLERNSRSALSIKCAASISMKANERGILDFCSGMGIPFKTFSPAEIKMVEHLFPSSDFVKSITGVGCVCEAAAVLGGNNARPVCPKTAYNGITLALAEEEKVIDL